MSDENILASAAGAFGASLLAAAFNGPLKSVDDLWYSHFGYKTAMMRAKHEADVDAYKQKIIEECTTVDPNNYQKPRLSIIGPAIEASRFYIEEDELRDMFAKLIASSIDKTKNEDVHPSFIEIIKQMSPNDAKLLKLLPSYGPLVDYNLVSKENARVTDTIASEVYLSSNVPTYSKENSMSINNLIRLSILDINKTASAVGVIDYMIYEQGSLYEEVQNLFDKNKDKFSKLDLKKYYFNTTLFGRSFKEICIN